MHLSIPKIGVFLYTEKITFKSGKTKKDFYHV